MPHYLFIVAVCLRTILVVSGASSNRSRLPLFSQYSVTFCFYRLCFCPELLMQDGCFVLITTCRESARLCFGEICQELSSESIKQRLLGGCSYPSPADAFKVLCVCWNQLSIPLLLKKIFFILFSNARLHIFFASSTTWDLSKKCWFSSHRTELGLQ